MSQAEAFFKEPAKYFSSPDGTEATGNEVPRSTLSAFLLLALQLNLAVQLHIFQTELRHLRPDQEGSIPLKQSIRIVKDIADGVAWRALRCNRFNIHVLSDNHQGGHFNDVSDIIAAQEESMTTVSAMMPEPPILLFNDLTNCLRNGDLTLAFDDGRIDLTELKARRAARKSRRAKTQRRRRSALLDDISQRHPVRDGTESARSSSRDLLAATYRASRTR